MKKIILWTINVSSIVLGLFFGTIWFNRHGLDYNSKGRFFDKTASVVHDKDELLVYGILTLFFITTGLISWVVVWRAKHTVEA